MKHIFPAVFTAEQEGGYSVSFPDIDGCYTCGDDLENAIYMAQDALAFALYDYEKNGVKIPKPSEAKDILLKAGEFVNYISCDTEYYHKRDSKKAVKKTLSIPKWLNEAATAAGINFSQVLQEALKAKLSL